jgi:signal transduction histidine kinase
VIQDRIAHLGPDDRPEVEARPLPAVTADPAMLRHVLDNLVGNALKYVQPDTRPRVEVRAGTAAEGWVRIEVADRGIGIPDEHKPAVFERFHRAHTGSGYAGTGLGLAICRRIVERHGGEVGVADNPGGGTVFHFTVPEAGDFTAPEAGDFTAPDAGDFTAPGAGGVDGVAGAAGVDGAAGPACRARAGPPATE